MLPQNIYFIYSLIISIALVTVLCRLFYLQPIYTLNNRLRHLIYKTLGKKGVVNSSQSIFYKEPTERKHLITVDNIITYIFPKCDLVDLLKHNTWHSHYYVLLLTNENHINRMHFILLLFFGISSLCCLCIFHFFYL